jgi:hypothetical protein
MGVGLTTGAVWYAHVSASLSFVRTLQQLFLPFVITALTVVAAYATPRVVDVNVDNVFLSILWHGSVIMLIYISLVVLFYRKQLRRFLQVAV